MLVWLALGPKINVSINLVGFLKAWFFVSYSFLAVLLKVRFFR